MRFAGVIEACDFRLVLPKLSFRASRGERALFQPVSSDRGICSAAVARKPCSCRKDFSLERTEREYDFGICRKTLNRGHTSTCVLLARITNYSNLNASIGSNRAAFLAG